jgi:4-hydroxy-tetrahydrodipicolinate reductase
MRIALIGYGKMGKEIEKIVCERRHQISVRIRSEDRSLFDSNEFLTSDVAIEFTAPEAASDNIRLCIDKNIPVVCGTTGWYNNLKEISDYCRKKNGSLFYASNFSLGVNLFFAMNRYLARLMNNFPEYEVSVKEIHHIHKKDKPSGTALTIIDEIMQVHSGYKEWNWNKNSPATIQVESVREGEVPGIHQVDYTSTVDKISLRHEAFNRKGFALGAVLAAEWLAGKKGVFTMKDLLNITE